MQSFPDPSFLSVTLGAKILQSLQSQPFFVLSRICQATGALYWHLVGVCQQRLIHSVVQHSSLPPDLLAASAVGWINYRHRLRGAERPQALSERLSSNWLSIAVQLLLAKSTKNTERNKRATKSRNYYKEMQNYWKNTPNANQLQKNAQRQQRDEKEQVLDFTKNTNET